MESSSDVRQVDQQQLELMSATKQLEEGVCPRDESSTGVADSDAAADERTGWLTGEKSLSEAYGSVKMPSESSPLWKQVLAFSGLGFMISVGYMDPGNWATDLAGGAKFGYTLLCVILLSNFTAMFLQHLALKLGIASGRDLAQACREMYPKYVSFFLWILAEIAIAACDLAEVIGCAVAMKLLFGLDLWIGVLITSLDALLVLIVSTRRFRILEVFISLLVVLIFGCFVYQMAAAQPNWLKVASGLNPANFYTIFKDSTMLYLSAGIIGATVMPHNLYLHSSIVQTRAYPKTVTGRHKAIVSGTIDSCVSLLFAFCINAAILILAAAAFHYGTPPRHDIADLQDAYKVLAPAIGAKAAPIIFGVALLASGFNSTLTGTLAGQIVMEGFLSLKLAPWLRRLLTRSVAVVPAALVAAIAGDAAVAKLLVLSQVILSMQLTFAVVPMIHVTSLKKVMGPFTNNWLVMGSASFIAVVIALINVAMLVMGIKDGSFW